MFDIGMNGARLRLEHPLPVGRVLVIYVHFQDPEKGVTTVRFVAIVIRAQAGLPHEIAVQFRRRGRFLRDRLEGARGLENPTAAKRDSAPWIN